MTKSQVQSELLKLPVEEQIQIVEAVWEHLEEARDEVAVTPGQRAVLEERLAAYRANPDDVRTWDEIMERVSLAP